MSPLRNALAMRIVLLALSSLVKASRFNYRTNLKVYVEFENLPRQNYETMSGLF